MGTRACMVFANLTLGFAKTWYMQGIQRTICSNATAHQSSLQVCRMDLFREMLSREVYPIFIYQAVAFNHFTFLWIPSRARVTASHKTSFRGSRQAVSALDPGSMTASEAIWLRFSRACNLEDVFFICGHESSALIKLSLIFSDASRSRKLLFARYTCFITVQRSVQACEHTYFRLELSNTPAHHVSFLQGSSRCETLFPRSLKLARIQCKIHSYWLKSNTLLYWSD